MYVSPIILLHLPDRDESYSLIFLLLPLCNAISDKRLDWIGVSLIDNFTAIDILARTYLFDYILENMLLVHDVSYSLQFLLTV